MNKRIFFLSFVAVLLSATAKAASADTIHAEQFGILPYTYENQTVKMQEALNGCKDVSIEKNLFPTPLAKEQTQTSNMP